MSWYKTGTITVTNGSKIITGTNSVWTNPLNGVSAGRMLLLPAAGTVQIYEIESVQSDTQLTLVSAFTGTTGTGKAYAIPTSPAVSIEQFAHEFAATLAYYQQQLSGWQQILTGTGNVTLTTPDGQAVTVRSQQAWDTALNGKANSSDVFLLKGSLGTNDLNKFLTVPETSVEALPDVNMRKNKLLGFDAYGDPIAIANQTGQYNPVEIALTTSPAPEDKQVYLLIGGYKVPAWPTRENTHMVGYPTAPRIVSPVFSFRAAVNHNYRIPFAILNAELSAALQVTADKPERFTTLKASRLTQSSGVIDMTTNYSERDDERSVITLTDTLSGTMQSFTVLHSYTPLDSLTVSVSTVNDGTIHMEYKPQSLPQNTHGYAAVIKPEVTISPDISHRVAHMLNYFNEAVVVRNNAVFTPFLTEITLEAPYKGSLEVILKDSLNGLTVSKFVDVDFAGR